MIVPGRCSGSSDPRYKTAWELKTGVPQETLIPRIKTAAYSKRFIILNRSPLILAYLGEHGDYILVDHHYCSCEGFIRRTTREGIEGCSHTYASRIALEKGWYRDASTRITPELLARIVWETLTGGVAYTLRRLLALSEEVGDCNNDCEGSG